jgi:hypothetical protein
MMLPQTLSAADVEDALSRVGLIVDRRNVGRALHQHPVDGVIAPGRGGQGWRVPRAALVDVAAAILCRRASKAAVARGRPAPAARLYRVDAGELLLGSGERELAKLVPLPLRREVRERQRLERERAEERRREEQRRRQEREEEERRRAAAAADACRRRRDEERRVHEGLARERVAKERKKLLDECYRVCFRVALEGLWAAGMPKGPRWDEHPDAQQLRRDFPHDRPSWWAPPPGLLELVKVDLPKQTQFPYTEPDRRSWAPPYEPGRRWPWRKSESDDDR